MGSYGRALKEEFTVTFDDPRNRVVLHNSWNNPHIVYINTYAELKEMPMTVMSPYGEQGSLRASLRRMYKQCKAMPCIYTLNVREYRKELAKFACHSIGIGNLPIEQMNKQ